MKCPKCGYTSFDHLQSCKKCGNDFAEFKARYNLRSLFPLAEKKVQHPALADKTEADAAAEASIAEATDFGFDLMLEPSSPDDRGRTALERPLRNSVPAAPQKTLPAVSAAPATDIASDVPADMEDSGEGGETSLEQLLEIAGGIPAAALEEAPPPNPAAAADFDFDFTAGPDIPAEEEDLSLERLFDSAGQSTAGKEPRAPEDSVFARADDAPCAEEPERSEPAPRLVPAADFTSTGGEEELLPAQPPSAGRMEQGHEEAGLFSVWVEDAAAQEMDFSTGEEPVPLSDAWPRKAAVGEADFSNPIPLPELPSLLDEPVFPFAFGAPLGEENASVAPVGGDLPAPPAELRDRPDAESAAGVEPAAFTPGELPPAESGESFNLDDFDRFEPAADAGPAFDSTVFPVSETDSFLRALEGEFESPAERPPAEEPALEPAADELPEPAPLARRTAAALTDLAVLGVIFVFFLLAGEIALGGTRPLAESLLDLLIPYFLVFFCVTFGYFTLFHFLLGQTLGKMLFRLRVTGPNGKSLLFSQAFLRSTGGLLSLLPAGAGYLPILLDHRRCGWNDRLAGTRVVCIRQGAPGAAPEKEPV